MASKNSRGKRTTTAPGGSGGLKVKVRRYGPTPEELKDAGTRTMASKAMKSFLGRARARLLTVEGVDESDPSKARKTPSPAKRYRATVYDYTNNRTVVAEGPIDRPAQAHIHEHNLQPPPTTEEFAEAVSLLRPLIAQELPTAQTHRIVAVGLLANEPGERHEILGVNLVEPGLHRFHERAPSAARADDGSCGASVDASQSTVERGTAGQAWVTVSQGGTTLWKFLVVRPAASSGTNGSGLELRFVDYRGKRCW